ncbi:TATA box-binding protein-like protein 1 [Chelonus insularis]|uniref:TATA box-binding protein-like protein 1 n=1 Tax=Chelonus insularis TaxID=460826 RepID=UPI00158EAB5A|nr:TATA box-binding protein-like protein 1 [Chelonus insularis]XP_034936948.1 TATA box-binding protein-like protein 1 [Chelonus insularis]
MLESKFQTHNIMATAIQKNGIKRLTNGNINHVESVEKLDDTGKCNANEDKIYKPPASEPVEDVEAQPEIDILIRNVVCSFSVRCHLNLREIALNGSNVEYRKENGMITMKLRRPLTTASIWSSGKVTCTGAETEEEAKIAARRIARSLQKLGFKVRFNNFRVVNVLGTCLMPWAIRITSFSMHHKENADYEPELHPGVTYKLKEPRATLKIFSTGSVTITAPSVAAVGEAIEQIFPLVYEFRKKRSPEDEMALSAKKRKSIKRFRKNEDEVDMEAEEMITDEEEHEEMCDSDASEGKHC